MGKDTEQPQESHNETNTILKTWNENALEWTKVIKKNEIASRKITSPAILQQILSNRVSSLLDMGCGEGWLSRELQEKGIRCTGMDATLALIHQAQKESKGSEFYCLSFEEIIAWSQGNSQENTQAILDKIAFQPQDAAVFNFCLYAEEEAFAILKSMEKLVKAEGRIFIQTLHPSAYVLEGAPYQSRWMNDAWKGLSGNFKNGHSWYFRVLEDWFSLFKKLNWTLVDLQEPRAKESIAPYSIIFTLTHT